MVQYLTVNSIIAAPTFSTSLPSLVSFPKTPGQESFKQKLASLRQRMNGACAVIETINKLR